MAAVFDSDGLVYKRQVRLSDRLPTYESFERDDDLSLEIADDLSLPGIGKKGKVTEHPKHPISGNHLEYRRRKFGR